MKNLLAVLLILSIVTAFSACTANSVADRGGEVLSGGQSNTAQPDKDGSAGKGQGAASSDNGPSVPSAPDSIAITRDAAIEKALVTAGKTRQEVRDLEAELDREGGRLVWEVDFESGNMEYSYDIDAETGDIAKAEREADN